MTSNGKEKKCNNLIFCSSIAQRQWDSKDCLEIKESIQYQLYRLSISILIAAE
jgi:hypothetical protein